MVVWLDCRKVFFTFSELLFYRDNASILALPCGVFIRSAFAGTHTVRLELSKFFYFFSTEPVKPFTSRVGLSDPQVSSSL